MNRSENINDQNVVRYYIQFGIGFCPCLPGFTDFGLEMMALG